MSFRKQYADLGVDKYYASIGDNYINPHEDCIHAVVKTFCDCWEIGDQFVDLACGSGEVTRALFALGYKHHNITATDPFLYATYQKRNDAICYSSSFRDLLVVPSFTKNKVVFCSYALHLFEDSWTTRITGSMVDAKALVIISPTNNVQVHPMWSRIGYTKQGNSHGNFYARKYHDFKLSKYKIIRENP